MDIEKFNDEEMVFKAYVMFKNGNSDIIYLNERTIAMLIEEKWGSPFIAYTDHKDIYISRVDAIQSICITSESTLTETEYDAMLDKLSEYNSKRINTIKVITDEKEISDSVKLSLERCNK